MVEKQLESTVFEKVLRDVVATLSDFAKKSGYSSAGSFEIAVAEALMKHPELEGFRVDYVPGSQTFPDIVVEDLYGVEVKYKAKDGWTEVANSVFEGSRAPGIEEIFVIFCKMGGTPEVRVRRYEEAIVHVRTSHMPRFQISMETEQPPLFNSEVGIPVSYQAFRSLPQDDKMEFLRSYARRKHPNGWLWWFGTKSNPNPSVEQVIVEWTDLSKPEKRRLAAEAVILCPEVLSSGRGGANRQKAKGYKKVSVYWLRAHGVSSGNVRDFLSAGSMAQPCPDGDYIRCTLRHIEAEMVDALRTMDSEVLAEYWGPQVDVRRPFQSWVQLAEKYTSEWSIREVLPEVSAAAASGK